MQAYATGLYGRTSKDDKKRMTIESQQSMLGSWATTDDGVSSVVGDYWDVGVSGKVPLSQRPDGKRLIADVTSGKVKAVAVAYVDRFGRTLLDGLQAAADLERQGVKLVSVGDGWDSRRGDSRLNFNLRLLIAEEEHRKIRERMEGGKVRAMDKDKAPPGGHLPFGYRIDPHGHLVVHASESLVVIRMFEMALKGHSNTEILAYVKSTGIRAGARYQKRERGSEVRIEDREGAVQWTLHRVHSTLTNPVYHGVRKWGERTFECPALVDAKAFEQVAVALDVNRERHRRKGKAEERLCSGFFTCEGCGSKFYFVPRACRRNPSRTDSYAYYICSGIRHGSTCRAKQIQAVELDKVVWDKVEDYLRDPDAIVQASIAADQSLRGEVSDFNQVEGELLTALSRVDADVAEIWQEKTANNWAMSFVVPRVNGMNTERDAILDRLKTVRRSRAAALVNKDSSAEVIAYLASYRANLADGLTQARKKEILRRLVVGGVIKTDGAGKQKTATLTIQLRWRESASCQVSPELYSETQPDATLPVVLTFPTRAA